MNWKKTLSIILAVAMILSAAALATAQSTSPAGTTETTPPVDETAAADESTVASEPVYTLDEMLTMAMKDAYERQSAYSAFTEAFPDSRSLAKIDMDTQIVLLEMLLKANGVAIPVNDASVTVPDTLADAYAAVAESESNALTMYRSFLNQQDLAPDAKIVFRSVFQQVRSNASDFARQVRSAQRVEKFQELMNDENAQVYVYNGNHGRGIQIVYVVNSDQTNDDSADDMTQDTTEPAAEGSMSN
ncbi:MAG TPA: hypothetical protein PKU80_04860 [Candidatus Limiplasma sp.]|nr:hypothetical protein [Candidatus Limiplasma sp.]HRX08730.1 hypothetical protein [Candidatus Limiplasma sp.]